MNSVVMQIDTGIGNSRKRKFLKDLGLYGIGNIGSKLITFMLVPLYTFFITDASEFGYYDVCLTVVFSLCPFIGLQLQDGGLRYLLETKDLARQRSIMSYIYKIVLGNTMLILVVGVSLSLFAEIKYLWFIVVYGLAQSYYEMTLQMVRGLGHTKYFAQCGLINAMLIAMLSALFVALMDMGVPGVFYANILARIVTLLYLELRIHIYSRYFRLSSIDRKIGHDLLKYSLPLLPAILIWYVVNSNNVFFIKHYIGLDGNGIYAIIGKFTGVLYILSFIFYQTWQQNAIEQYRSTDRDDFFSKVFNMYLYLLAGLMILVPFGLRINYGWLVGPEYQESSRYLFLNSFYVVFYALSNFFELGYQCSKNTRRVLPGLLLAMVTSIISNWMFIRWWGMYGVIFANILSYAALLLYRVLDTRKYMKIRFYTRNLPLIGLVVCAGIVYQLSWSVIVDVIGVLLLLCIYIFFAPKSFRKAIVSRLPLKGKAA